MFVVHCVNQLLTGSLCTVLDPDIFYLRSLSRRAVLLILDELYLERTNLYLFSCILLAAAGDLLKLLGWDMISTRAVEREQDTVLLPAAGLRAKAAGFCFAFGRVLQAIELHSQVWEGMRRACIVLF